MDYRLFETAMKGIKDEPPESIVEVVSDKWYDDTDDMINWLENGIVPHVIIDYGKDGYELRI